MSDIVWENGLNDQYGYDRYDDGLYNEAPDGWHILVDHDWAGDYEFALLVVWQNLTTGELRAAYDSGCSCPNPFAGLTLETTALITELDDLKPLVAEAGLKWKGRDEGLAEIKARVHRALRDGPPPRESEK